MQKQKIILSFSKYKQTDLLQKARVIQYCLKNKCRFANLLPTPGELETAIKTFESTVIRPTTKDIKTAGRKELISTLKRIGLFVEKESGGNAAVILGAGFDLSKKPKKVGPLGEAKNFQVKPTGKGEITLRCKPNKHARTYLWEYRQEDGVRWIQESTTAAKLVLKGLESGKNYLFRVMLVGTSEIRTYSGERSSVVM